MNFGSSFFSRFGGWFSRTPPANGELPLIHQVDQGGAIERVQIPRYSLLRPWARRDAAIDNLQTGFQGLTEVIRTLCGHLAQQNERHNELLQYMTRLPDALEAIPQTNRLHEETLTAIRQHVESQGAHQRQLVEILGQINEAGAGQRLSLDALHDRMELISQHGQAISLNLNGMGSALQSVSEQSQTSTQVLQELRDSVAAGDAELEKILLRESARLTMLLTALIALGAIAVAALGVIGYLVLHRMHSP